MRAMGLSKEEAESLWKQLEIIVDLYKFFFEWVLKLDIFFYSITGAIVSFYFSKPVGSPFRHALLLPLLFSILLLFLFASGERGLRKTQEQAQSIVDRLGLILRLDIRYLPNFLAVNALMCLIIAGALAWLHRYGSLTSKASRVGNTNTSSPVLTGAPVSVWGNNPETYQAISGVVAAIGILFAWWSLRETQAQRRSIEREMAVRMRPWMGLFDFKFMPSDAN